MIQGIQFRGCPLTEEAVAGGSIPINCRMIITPETISQTMEKIKIKILSSRKNIS